MPVLQGNTVPSGITILKMVEQIQASTQHLKLHLRGFYGILHLLNKAEVRALTMTVTGSQCVAVVAGM